MLFQSCYNFELKKKKSRQFSNYFFSPKRKGFLITSRGHWRKGALLRVHAALQTLLSQAFTTERKSVLNVSLIRVSPSLMVSILFKDFISPFQFFGNVKWLPRLQRLVENAWGGGTFSKEETE